MLTKKTAAAAPMRTNDPFMVLRQMTSELDRFFTDAAWPDLRVPLLAEAWPTDTMNWVPNIDVFEKDETLVTRIDLPGMKKEDVKVEIADGRLIISGERTTESEEKKENVVRSERKYGAFRRTVAIPETVTPDAVKATFADGVLEVTVPLPAAPKATEPRTVAIETPNGAKTAA